MFLKKAILIAPFVLGAIGAANAQNGATVPVASAQTGDSGFSLLAGKNAPLTLHVKDLDSSWRVFTTSSGSSMDFISMMGGGGGRIFTKGDTVAVGSDVFLIAYKSADGPDMTALMSGKPPKPKPLTADSVLRLSLLNLHTLSSMDGIKVFDLKEQLAMSDASPMTDIIAQTSSGSDGDTEPALLKDGTTAPDFTVRDDANNPVKLSNYRGKVVVLDFWATWCGPCQESLPKTNELAAKYSKQNVVFLGVNVWDEKKAFHEWLPKHKSFSSMKFAIDTSGQGQDVASKLYHVSGIPTQYVIDAQGKIVKSTVGYSEDESDLTSAIKLALTH